MATEKNMKLAVLIDADNAQATITKELMMEISTYGTASVKRAYGDWTTTNLKGWKEVLHRFAIQPIQQFAYTTGKNSTDSSLIIDAMDLLHAGRVDGICLISSDSDFTRLATRIREAGLIVYGFGEQKTPSAFVAACDKFIYTEILRGPVREGKKDSPLPETAPVVLNPAVPEDEGFVKLESLVRNAILANEQEDGLASLSAVGLHILKNDPSFDPRNYGVEKLGALMHRLSYVEVTVIKANPPSRATHLHVKLK